MAAVDIAVRCNIGTREPISATSTRDFTSQMARQLVLLPSSADVAVQASSLAPPRPIPDLMQGSASPLKVTSIDNPSGVPLPPRTTLDS